MKLTDSQNLALRQALVGETIGDWVTSHEHPGFIVLSHKDGTYKDGWASNIEGQYEIHATPDWDSDKGELAVTLARPDGTDPNDAFSYDCQPSADMAWTGDTARDIKLWRARVGVFIGCIENHIFPHRTTTSVAPRDLEIVNRRRRVAGMKPIDMADGWSVSEIEEMAENIRTTGRLPNPGARRNVDSANLKKELMR